MTTPLSYTIQTVHTQSMRLILGGQLPRIQDSFGHRGCRHIHNGHSQLHSRFFYAENGLGTDII